MMQNDKEFNKNELRDMKSEIFNSDYYFDDIIEELNDSGLYSDDNLIDSDDKVIKEDTVEQSDRLNSQMDEIKENLDVRIKKIEDKVLNINEMLFSNKNELLQSLQKMQNNILLFKFETEEGINRVSDLFKEKITKDEVKEKAFEELYSQLDSYKRNFVDTAMKPFVQDLLLFYDRITSDIEHCKVNDHVAQSDSMVTFKDELLEILYRNDITPVEKSLEGEKFNAEKSNAIEKIETTENDKDNTIKIVLKEGFKKGESVIRPEIVQIYKYVSY
ncbi:MAG: nucleotide exchange factor GrpE [Candidatus Delongbacteria bacterium]|jgi:molecular chaperone GrpE (heat shock protein)|nr:nucleotide exchange factor GrpE [Candidatus Delongbacteria bacterium]